MQESGPASSLLQSCTAAGRQLIESMLDVTVTTGWLVGCSRDRGTC